MVFRVSLMIIFVKVMTIMLDYIEIDL